MHFVASDFDGTIFINGEVKAEDIKAIKIFRKQGNIFVICTGRPIDSVLEKLILHDVPFDYIIGVNGAIAVDKAQTILYSHEIKQEVVRHIDKILNQYEINEYLRSTGINQVTITKDHQDLGVGIEMVRGYYIDAMDDSNAFSLVQKLNSELGKKGITAYPNGKYVAIGMGSIHKGYGVGKLAELISWKGMISVIGDDYNDIPMFKRFESYGIKTGFPDAISFAKYHVDSIADVLYGLMNSSN